MRNIIALAASLVIVAVVYRILRYVYEDKLRASKERQLQCGPVPTLKPNPWLFGLDVVHAMTEEYFSGTRNHRLEQQFNTIGLTFRTQASDAIRTFTIDPENVKAVFGGDIHTWGVEPIRLEAFKPAFGVGVLVTDGHRWKHARKPLQAIVDKVYHNRIANLPQLDCKIDQLIKLVPTDGTTVDLQPLLNLYMIDTASEYVLGTSVNALEPGPMGQIGKEYLSALLYGMGASGERDEIPSWTMEGLKSRLWNTSSQTFALIHQVTDQYLQDIRRRLSHSIDGEGVPICLAAEWAKNVSDPLEIRAQMLNVLTAAFDTTAILLGNVIFQLARHPQIYQKLRDEVTNCPENITIDELKGLQYLNDVLKESLRLNAPGTFNSRVALCDTTIPKGGGPDGGCSIFVAKGDIVITSIYSIHRNKAVYGNDADSFRPERWEKIQPKHWDYIPFSAGPRTCPGQQLALPHAAYVLYYLTRQYTRIECRDPVQEYVELYRITTASKNGVKVAMYID